MKRACLINNRNTNKQSYASSIRSLRINFIRLKSMFFILIILLLTSCNVNKSNKKYIVCSDSIGYWDFISENHSGNMMGGMGFSKDGSVKTFTLEDGYRWIDNDVENCEKWNLTNDSIFTSKCPDSKVIYYMKMKIIKYTEDTIFGEGLIVKGRILLVKVRDVKTIIKPDNPRYKKKFKNALIRQLGI